MGILSISGIEINFQCNHLTYAEHERIAYITGNGFLASTLADASVLEHEVCLFDAVLEPSKEDLFDSGK